MHKYSKNLWKESNKSCPKCKKIPFLYREVEDNNCHEDINYWCPHCLYQYWVEGSDY